MLKVHDNFRTDLVFIRYLNVRMQFPKDQPIFLKEQVIFWINRYHTVNPNPVALIKIIDFSKFSCMFLNPNDFFLSEL